MRKFDPHGIAQQAETRLDVGSGRALDGVVDGHGGARTRAAEEETERAVVGEVPVSNSEEDKTKRRTVIPTNKRWGQLCNIRPIRGFVYFF